MTDIMMMMMVVVVVVMMIMKFCLDKFQAHE